MRRENRFLCGCGLALEARLDEVEMDQRLRFRKPSLRPPRLLDRECVVLPESRRRVFVFFGDTESSSWRLFTGSAKLDVTAGALKGSYSVGDFFEVLSLTVIRGGGRRDDVRGRDDGRKCDWEGLRLRAEVM